MEETLDPSSRICIGMQRQDKARTEKKSERSKLPIRVPALSLDFIRETWRQIVSAAYLSCESQDGNFETAFYVAVPTLVDSYCGKWKLRTENSEEHLTSHLSIGTQRLVSNTILQIVVMIYWKTRNLTTLCCAQVHMTMSHFKIHTVSFYRKALYHTEMFEYMLAYFCRFNPKSTVFSVVLFAVLSPRTHTTQPLDRLCLASRTLHPSLGNLGCCDDIVSWHHCFPFFCLYYQ